MRTASVLLVDDETEFIDTMAKRLKKKGLIVFTAYSGREALEALRNHPATEVVVLDVKMPGMNGIEALNHIKRSHPRIEVIMLSGHATVDIAIEGMDRGAFDFLLKPCELSVLMAKIEEAVLQKRRQEEKIEAARALQRSFHSAGGLTDG